MGHLVQNDGSRAVMAGDGRVARVDHANDCALIAAAPQLLAALKSLRNEVLGAISIGVSDSIGHTNARCLGNRCQEAYEAIAKAEAK